jgi:hypothetical protein
MRPIDIPAGRPTPPADGPPRTARWPGAAAAKPLFLDFDPVLPWWPPATAGRYDTHHRPSTGKAPPPSPAHGGDA